MSHAVTWQLALPHFSQHILCSYSKCNKFLPSTRKQDSFNQRLIRLSSTLQQMMGLDNDKTSLNKERSIFLHDSTFSFDLSTFLCWSFLSYSRSFSRCRSRLCWWLLSGHLWRWLLAAVDVIPMGPVAMVPGYEMSEAKTRNRLQSAWILGSKIQAPKQEYFLKKVSRTKQKKWQMI